MSDPNLRAVGPLSNAASVQSVPVTRDARGKFLINSLPAGVCPDDVRDLVRGLSKRAFPRTPVLNGFCILLHKPTVERLGFLDESNFPFGYGEETDLCLRLIYAGYNLAIADNVYVYHSKSASFGSAKRQKFTNQANKNLKRMWPGYSYRYIADAIEEVAPLEELKRALIPGEKMVVPVAYQGLALLALKIINVSQRRNERGFFSETYNKRAFSNVGQTLTHSYDSLHAML
jgi:hypothetical protein